jgi:hypothetical protein
MLNRLIPLKVCTLAELYPDEGRAKCKLCKQSLIAMEGGTKNSLPHFHIATLPNWRHLPVLR